MGELLSISCPECGEDVWDVPPRHWIVPGEAPRYSHVSDRTALCPVMTVGGYRPAEPVEHQIAQGDVVGVQHGGGHDHYVHGLHQQVRLTAGHVTWPFHGSA